MIEAKLITYDKETIINSETVLVNDNYDADCYGDTVPFAVGSNQSIIITDEKWINEH